MKKWYETVFENNSGFAKPAVGVSVAIYQAGTSNLATIYEDDGTTPKLNPLTSDANGFVSAKVADGTYDIVFSKNGVELHRIAGAVFADFDPDNVNLNGGTIQGVQIDNCPIGVNIPAPGFFSEGGSG